MENQEKPSFASRIIAAPVLLGLVGVACMIYGLAQGFKLMQFFFGLCIVAGSFLLHFVRKKDWDAHWAEMEQARQAHEKRMADEAEKKR